VAILGRNSKNWAIAYLATVGYGAVVVPIMPDFHPDDVHHIVNHSGTVLLFADTALFEALDEEEMKNLEGTFSLERFELLSFRKKHLREVVDKASLEYLHDCKGRLDQQNFRLPAQDNKELAAIVYTSGTTGFSKGVMLPCNSLMGNVKFARENLPLKAGDRLLSFLPIAHCYGCAFDFLFPFITGLPTSPFWGRSPPRSCWSRPSRRSVPGRSSPLPLVAGEDLQEADQAQAGQGGG
jgi:long-chain acyl-CoA synthetase